MRASIARTVTRTPEVMVKISGWSRDMASIKRAASYQSQAKGRDAVIEDEHGALYSGRGCEHDVVAGWSRGVLGPPIPSEASPVPRQGDRHAMNLVLSMPAGTPIDAVTGAARAFGEAEFGDRHAYFFTAHDDTDHAHVHMTVRLTGHDGSRLKHKIPDLARWRGTFARELRERGVAANATPRRARWVEARSVPQPVYHARTGRGESPRPALREATDDQGRVLGQGARETYRTVRDALERSADPADQQLARAITDYAEPQRERAVSREQDTGADIDVDP